MTKKAFDKIKAGFNDAIAHAQKGKTVIVTLACENGPQQVLGRRITDHFAWTPTIYRPEGAAEDMESETPEQITHLPTGLRVARAERYTDARRIALAFEALPVDWASADAETLHTAAVKAMDKPAREWVEDVLASAPAPKPRPGMLERVSSSRPWAGSTVTGPEPHELTDAAGDCKDPKCSRVHVAISYDYYRRGRRNNRVDRRHRSVALCWKVVHPSGAVAWIRAE